MFYYFIFTALRIIEVKVILIRQVYFREFILFRRFSFYLLLLFNNKMKILKLLTIINNSNNVKVLKR